MPGDVELSVMRKEIVNVVNSTFANNIGSAVAEVCQIFLRRYPLLRCVVMSWHSHADPSLRDLVRQLLYSPRRRHHEVSIL